MRIALVGTGVQAIPPVGYGGVERTIAEFAEALRRAGHEPVVLNRVRHGRPVDEYLFALSVPGLVREARAAAVHASTPVVANRLALAGIPYVYTSHSRHWFERSGARQRWGFWLERRALARSRATVALTGRLHAEMVRRVPSASARVHVVPIGVDTDRFRPAPDGRTGRAALGVGVVARLKRWEIAARAARDAGWSFRLVGPTPDGPYAEELRSLGPGVELLGEVTDEELRKEFGRADVLLHPSRVEVLAGTVLQGLASALPVLGAEPVADLVEPGVTGWTTPARAPDDEVYGSFVEWLGRLSDPQLRRTMGAAARISAETRFSWESVVRAHVTLYEDVFGAAARP